MANGGLLGKEAHIKKVASAVTTSFTASGGLSSTGALLADVLVVAGVAVELKVAVVLVVFKT